MPNNIATWLVIHDLHFPKINWPTFNAALDFLEQNHVAGVILGGDQFDNEEISHHTKGKALFRPRASYHRNTTEFDAKILKALEARLHKDAKRVWIVGNHDRFEQDLIEEHPELEGTIERPQLLEIKKRKWQIVPLGHAYKLGKLNVIHGEILTGIGNQCGIYPSKKAVELYGTSVLAGHTHAPQSFAKISPVERTQKHMAWIAPCCCDVNPTYLQNRPTAWLNGVTVVEVMSNGMFNVFPCICIDDRFAYGGKIYGRA